jgi:flagellar motor switch protein FliG
MPISFDIPKGEIENAIALAIAESFTPERKEAMVRDIVRAHLSYRESTYDKETLLSKAVGKIVRDIATEKMTAIVNDMRPKIEGIIVSCLGPAFKESVFKQLDYALKNKMISNIRIMADMDSIDE